MSGTVTSIRFIMFRPCSAVRVALSAGRGWPVRVDAVAPDCIEDRLGREPSFVRQRLEGRDHDEMPVHLEVPPEGARTSLRPKPSVPSTT